MKKCDRPVNLLLEQGNGTRFHFPPGEQEGGSGTVAAKSSDNHFLTPEFLGQAPIS